MAHRHIRVDQSNVFRFLTQQFVIEKPLFANEAHVFKTDILSLFEIKSGLFIPHVAIVTGKSVILGVLSVEIKLDVLERHVRQVRVIKAEKVASPR